MSWFFNPFSVKLDYFESTPFEIVAHDANATLDAGDLKKIHIMDVSGGDKQFILPAASASLIGEWVVLVRKGVANILQVCAVGTDVIFNSSAGGYIVTTDSVGDPDTHNFSSIFLVVMEEGVWGNPSFGIWSSH